MPNEASHALPASRSATSSISIPSYYTSATALSVAACRQIATREHAERAKTEVQTSSLPRAAGHCPTCVCLALNTLLISRRPCLSPIGTGVSSQSAQYARHEATSRADKSCPTVCRDWHDVQRAHEMCGYNQAEEFIISDQHRRPSRRWRPARRTRWRRFLLRSHSFFSSASSRVH